MKTLNLLVSRFCLCSVLFLFFGCSQKTGEKIKTVEVEKVVLKDVFKEVKIMQPFQIDSSIGVESYPEDIEKWDPTTSQAAQAVFQFANADGSTASGFFISEDGYFLTNNHVISKYDCQADGRCPGLRIIREFRKNSKKVVVHRNFEVFATVKDENGKSLDFAIGKVHLKTGEKVPFLELDKRTPEEISKDLSKFDQLVVLGHPGGAPLKGAKAKANKIKKGDSGTLVFNGVVIPGNSGGALFDTKSKKVIGLVKSLSYETHIKDQVVRVQLESYATLIGAIVKRLELEGMKSWLDLPSLQKIQSSSTGLGNFQLPLLMLGQFVDSQERSFPEALNLYHSGQLEAALESIVESGQLQDDEKKESFVDMVEAMIFAFGSTDFFGSKTKSFLEESLDGTLSIFWMGDKSKMELSRKICLEGYKNILDKVGFGAAMNACLTNKDANNQSLFQQEMDRISKNFKETDEALVQLHYAMYFAKKIPEGIPEEDINYAEKVIQGYSKQDKVLDQFFAVEGGLVGLRSQRNHMGLWSRDE